MSPVELKNLQIKIIQQVRKEKVISISSLSKLLSKTEDLSDYTDILATSINLSRAGKVVFKTMSSTGEYILIDNRITFQ